MAKEKTTTEVAEVKQTALAVAAADFMMDDMGAGFEGADKDSYATPFLQILQKMSPLVDEDSPKYVQGAKAGMFYNTVTQQLFDGKAGIILVPCAYKRSFILWGGREGDGGFKGEFTPEQYAAMEADPTKVKVIDGKGYVPDEKGNVDTKKSDYYADTRSHYVLVVDPATGDWSPAILSLASSQIKASRMLMTSLQQKKVDTPQGKRTPPTFANLVRATTVGMSNDSGSWSGVKFELEGLVANKDMYADAKAFYAAFAGGEVKADYSKADRASTDGPVEDKPQQAEGF